LRPNMKHIMGSPLTSDKHDVLTPFLNIKSGAGCCCSILMLLLAAAGFAEFRRYSPLYEDIVCFTGTTSILVLSVVPIRARVVVNIDCSNPNPYGIAVDANGLGKLLVGNDKRPTGSTRSTRALLKAEKGGTIQLELNVELDSVGGFLSMFTSVLTGPVNIYFELKLVAHVNPTIMLLKPKELNMKVLQQCGIQISLSGFNGRAGDAVCEATFDTLVIPSVDLIGNSTSGITPEIDPALLQDARKSVDLLCVTFMVIGSLFGVLCICVPCGISWRSSRIAAKDVDICHRTYPAETIGKTVVDNNANP